LKKLIVIIISALFLSASPVEKERSIYRTILNAIFPDKTVIHVWLDNPKKRAIFEKIRRVISLPPTLKEYIEDDM